MYNKNGIIQNVLLHVHVGIIYHDELKSQIHTLSAYLYLMGDTSHWRHEHGNTMNGWLHWNWHSHRFLAPFHSREHCPEQFDQYLDQSRLPKSIQNLPKLRSMNSFFTSRWHYSKFGYYIIILYSLYIAHLDQRIQPACKPLHLLEPPSYDRTQSPTDC